MSILEYSPSPAENKSLPLILSYAAMMALAIAINLMPVFLVNVSADFGNLSPEQAGRIGAVTFAGLVAAILLSGPLVDRLPPFGAKAFAIAGNLLIAAGLLLLAYAKSYPLLLAASFIMGFGAGSLDMILSPIVAALRPNHRTVALNLLHGFYCVGAVLTILAGALALHFGFSWRSASLAIIAFPVLVAAGFLFTKIPPLVAEGSTRTPLHRLLSDSFFLLAMLAITLGGATEIGLAYWMPTYAQSDLGFTKLTADMAFLGFSLAMAVGRLAIAFIGHRITTIHLLMISCALSAILFALAAFGSPMLALASCILAGLAGSTLWPSTLALASDRHPHGGASMFALLSALGNAGGILMPWIIGLIADAAPNHSLRWGIAVGGLCPLFLLAILLAMKRIAPQISLTHLSDSPTAP